MFRPTNWNPIEFMEYVAPDGTRFKFDNQYRFLMSESNLGMPPIEYIDQQGPFQHGKTIYDYRLQQRIISILYRENACDRQSYWNNRANILNILRPNRQPTAALQLGTLIKTLPNGTQRAINVIISEGLAFQPRQQNRWDEWSLLETIQFIAPDPTFFDPSAVSDTWMKTGVSHLILPFYFDSVTGDMAFSSLSSTAASFNITYPGTWLSYPTITIRGPVANPVITNVTTGEVITINYSIAALETVTISLPYGNKTIVSSTAGNIIGYASSDSDIATFHIEPEPRAVGGVNLITVSGTGFVANVSYVTLSYYVRYIGI